MVWEWSGGPPDGPAVFGRPSQRYESDWETLLEVREWSGGPPEVREWSVGPPECSDVVLSPSQRSGSVREALPEVRE